MKNQITGQVSTRIEKDSAGLKGFKHLSFRVQARYLGTENDLQITWQTDNHNDGWAEWYAGAVSIEHATNVEQIKFAARVMSACMDEYGRFKSPIDVLAALQKMGIQPTRNVRVADGYGYGTFQYLTPGKWALVDFPDWGTECHPFTSTPEVIGAVVAKLSRYNSTQSRLVEWLNAGSPMKIIDVDPIDTEGLIDPAKA